MYHNVWIELVKEDMKNSVNQLKYDTVLEQKKLFTMYFDLLEAIEKLQDYKASIGVVEGGQVRLQIGENEQEEKGENEGKEELVVEQQELQAEAPRKMYVFERKLRGGYVPEIEGFVPEGLVRKHKISHLDYVYAREVEADEGQKKKFIYELAMERNLPGDPNRVQLNFCPIEVEAGRLVVKRTLETGKDIRVNDVPYVAVLPEEDIREQDLKEHDVVDIAYYKEKPERVKVIWKHDTPDIPRDEMNQVKAAVAAKKKEVKKEEESVLDYVDTLEGKNILVIGDEPRRALYQLSIEQRGGHFMWTDTNKRQSQYEPFVKKADVVIFLLAVSGHEGMYQIKALCKKHKKPFLTTFNLGKSSIVRIAEEAVGNL